MTNLIYENIDDFIDSFRQQHGIKLRDIYNYAESHYDELQNMDNVLKYETKESASLCNELARILAPEWADDIIKFLNKEQFNDEPETSKHTLELISAFIYNPQFLKKSWDWCIVTYFEAKENAKIIQFPPSYTLTQNPIRILKQAATPAGIREILKDTITWNNRQCDVFGFLFQNGEVTFELHIKDTKGLENATELKLSITILNEDISVREEPLKFWNDSWNPGETAVYSTGNIKIVDYDRIIINELNGE
ncbi:MAG: hypothetical protein FWD26_07900 [Treponema sp.]|nr:hypothetical protein [Treponema sp.]